MYMMEKQGSYPICFSFSAVIRTKNQLLQKENKDRMSASASQLSHGETALTQKQEKSLEEGNQNMLKTNLVHH